MVLVMFRSQPKMVLVPILGSAAMFRAVRPSELVMTKSLVADVGARGEAALGVERD